MWGLETSLCTLLDQPIEMVPTIKRCGNRLPMRGNIIFKNVLLKKEKMKLDDSIIIPSFDFYIYNAESWWRV